MYGKTVGEREKSTHAWWIKGYVICNSVRLCVCVCMCVYTLLYTYGLCKYIHYITLNHMRLHCHTLHYITLHYITLHYMTIHYIALHYITLPYITLHYPTLPYITRHYQTLHDITSHHITLHYMHYIYIYICVYNIYLKKSNMHRHIMYSVWFYDVLCVYNICKHMWIYWYVVLKPWAHFEIFINTSISTISTQYLYVDTDIQRMTAHTVECVRMSVCLYACMSICR